MTATNILDRHLISQPSNGFHSPASHDEMLCLSGRPSLKQFLSIIAENATNSTSEGKLVDEWHAANEVVRRLEKEEAGCADGPPVTALGDEYEPLLIELLGDPILQAGFNTVPTQIAMVDLDRLLVYQRDIDLSHVRRLEDRLRGAALDRDVIFRVCLPFDHPRPPAQWSRPDSDSFTFISPSRDMRSFRPILLSPGNLQNYAVSADFVGVAGIGVGFGSNFLNAIHIENRLILNNGSHRAVALRRLGVTHVPCIVQRAPSREALNLLISGAVRNDPSQYLENPRPPMLKDYLNPEITKIFLARRYLRQVTVRFEVTETFIPAL